MKLLVHARLAALSAVLLLLSVAWAPAQKERHPFGAEVEAHFQSWDSNRDGTLSHAEVETLVRSHKVRGDEAAAVAAVHVYFRSHPGHPPLSLDFLRNTKDGKEERRDQAQKSAHFQSDFSAFSNHLAQVPRQVFTSSVPSVNGMSQGHLGDCFFVSPIGALVHRDPGVLKRMVRVGSDGVTEIAFGDGRHAKVPPLTDSLVCLGSTARQQGLWLNVLEEGYGEIRSVKSAKQTDAGSRAAIDKIAKGGDAGATIELLTGRKAQTVPVRKTAPERLHQAMLHAATTRKLMCAGTAAAAEHPLPPGVVGHHDYAVLGIKGNEVTMWNPWGNHFEPKGSPPGLQHGYKTENGVFTLPFADFEKVFSSVFIETDTPHRGR